LTAALLIWAFIQISNEIVYGGSRAFDMEILVAAQALRTCHPWIADSMRDLSGLGSTTVLTLFTVLGIGYLAVVRARLAALLLALAGLTGSLLVIILKAHFGRSRPDANFAEFVVAGMSFPSGHATNSAIVLLTIAALLASTRVRTRERVYILVAATLMTLLVGMSRIALGVHWATDVAAGFALGAGWAMGWLLLARALYRHAT
jgi:undecaprenyl-diphosphatase